MFSVNLVLWGIVGFLMHSSSGAPAMSRKQAVAALNNDEVYEAFKQKLITTHGVKEDFANQLKDNLRKAIMFELKEAQLRQGIDEDEDEEEETEAPTTAGPSPLNIVNGIYGILSGVGTLNPDRIFSATVNFVPPSQRETAEALVSSALGMKTTFPTPTTTKPTTTTPSTTTKDDYYDEDEDETTKAAVVAAVASATAAPAAAAAPVAVAAAPVAATAAVASATSATSAVQPKSTGEGEASQAPPVVPAATSAPVATDATTLQQDDEADLEINLSHLNKL